MTMLFVVTRWVATTNAHLARTCSNRLPTIPRALRSTVVAGASWLCQFVGGNYIAISSAPCAAVGNVVACPNRFSGAVQDASIARQHQTTSTGVPSRSGSRTVIMSPPTIVTEICATYSSVVPAKYRTILKKQRKISCHRIKLVVVVVVVAGCVSNDKCHWSFFHEIIQDEQHIKYNVSIFHFFYNEFLSVLVV